MTKGHKSEDFIHQPRRDRMYEEHVQDSYKSREKLPEPTVCPDCSAIFHKGRWQWGDSQEGAHKHRCPACRRIHDRVPAGILSLSGEFFEAHKEEIMKLVRNTEVKEKTEHPLERIMSVDEQAQESRTVISYTGIHLTKGTGEALHHAYQGQFNFEYSDGGSVLHASWQR